MAGAARPAPAETGIGSGRRAAAGEPHPHGHGNRAAVLLDARRRGETCRPLDFLPEVHHPIGGGEAVIPDALVYYQRGSRNGDGGSMLRAFLEVDRATMGPERLAAKLRAYARLHQYAPIPVGRRGRRGTVETVQEEWRRHYPLFPRLLFVLDGTGPAGFDSRVRALHAADVDLSVALFLREVTVLAAPMTDLLQHGPAAAVWHPVRHPGRRAGWMDPTDAVDVP
ncbi:replication-relaxation family protein [Streptomyces phaeofaciens]